MRERRRPANRDDSHVIMGPVVLTADTGPALFEALHGAKSHARPDGGSDGLTVPHYYRGAAHSRVLLRWGDTITVHSDGRVTVISATASEHAAARECTA